MFFLYCNYIFIISQGFKKLIFFLSLDLIGQNLLVNLSLVYLKFFLLILFLIKRKINNLPRESTKNICLQN